MFVSIEKAVYSALIVLFSTHSSTAFYFYIQSTDSGLVLDISHENVAPGTNINMYHLRGSDNQLWQYDEVNRLIVSKLNGLVLCSINTSWDVVTCVPDFESLEQRWYFDSDSTIRQGTGRVMDVENGSKKEGAKLMTYSKSGKPHQRFKMVPL